MLVTLLQILWIFVSLFLILIILLQRGKGGGLAGALGGAGGSSAFGTKAGDVFTKITVGVFGFWLLLAMILVWSLKTPNKFPGAGGGKNVAAGGAAVSTEKKDDGKDTEKEKFKKDIDEALKNPDDQKKDGTKKPDAPVLPVQPGDSQKGSTTSTSTPSGTDKKEESKTGTSPVAPEKSPPSKTDSKNESSKQDPAKSQPKANPGPTKAPGSGMNTPDKKGFDRVSWLAANLQSVEGGDIDVSKMTEAEKARVNERLRKTGEIYDRKDPTKTP